MEIIGGRTEKDVDLVDALLERLYHDVDAGIREDIDNLLESIPENVKKAIFIDEKSDAECYFDKHGKRVGKKECAVYSILNNHDVRLFSYRGESEKLELQVNHVLYDNGNNLYSEKNIEKLYKVKLPINGRLPRAIIKFVGKAKVDVDNEEKSYQAKVESVLYEHRSTKQRAVMSIQNRYTFDANDKRTINNDIFFNEIEEQKEELLSPTDASEKADANERAREDR